LSTKFACLCLLLAVSPALTQERRAEPPVAVYISFQQSPPAEVAEGLQEEVDALMEPVGMHLEWRSLEKVTGSEISAELAVVKFQGKCDSEGLTMKSDRPAALGWTHVSDGIILPFADVDCDRIRSFVQKELLFQRVADRPAIFARAVARVVAHELFHIFTQTAHHSAEGVGKSAFTVQELLGEEFQFQGKEAGMLKTIAMRFNPPAAGDRPVGTP
jgi:hypothetical protein